MSINIIIKFSQLAAINSKEYVNQKEACHILSISDTVLRNYCNDLNEHSIDLKGLNGYLEGKLWRFERQEVHRFGEVFWGGKAKELQQGEGLSDSGENA